MRKVYLARTLYLPSYRLPALLCTQKKTRCWPTRFLAERAQPCPRKKTCYLRGICPHMHERYNVASAQASGVKEFNDDETSKESLSSNWLAILPRILNLTFIFGVKKTCSLQLATGGRLATVAPQDSKVWRGGMGARGQVVHE